MEKDDFCWNHHFVRTSDSLPGQVVYMNDKAQIVVVRFGNNHEVLYEMDGTPLRLYMRDHRLVNI